MDPMEGLRAAMAAVDTYYKERGIFQGRFGFGRCPALVVIDMAYGWTDPAYAGGSDRVDSAVAALERLLPAARAKGVPVIEAIRRFVEREIACDGAEGVRAKDAVRNVLFRARRRPLEARDGAAGATSPGRLCPRR